MFYKCIQGDSLAILPTLPDNSIDSIVTDPPLRAGHRRDRKSAHQSC
jgi:DNA modification methylase